MHEIGTEHVDVLWSGINMSCVRVQVPDGRPESIEHLEGDGRLVSRSHTTNFKNVDDSRSSSIVMGGEAVGVDMRLRFYFFLAQTILREFQWLS